MYITRTWVMIIPRTCVKLAMPPQNNIFYRHTSTCI